MRVPLLGAVLAMGLIIPSCGGEGFLVDSDLISKYHSNVLDGSEIISSADENKIMCYLDYSIGVGPAMKETSTFNQALKNFFESRSVEYFRIGEQDTAQPIEDINSAEASFDNLNNYTDRGSKLGVAIDACVNNKTAQSIFISDFERVDDADHLVPQAGFEEQPHPIKIEAWATRQFKNWLQSGNQLDIYCYPYSRPDAWFDKSNSTPKPTYPNHLYTIVFTPKPLIEDNSNVISYLNEKVLEFPEFQHYEFNLNGIRKEVNHTTAEIGSANEILTVYDIDLNESPQQYEYYQFSGEELAEFVWDDAYEDKRLITGLKIFEEIDCIENISYDLNVFDITSNLEEFYTSIYSNEEVVTDTNQEDGSVDTISGGALVAYEFDNGVPNQDFFEFVYNVQTKEAGIKLNKDFTGVDEDKVFRVDFVITDVERSGFDEKDYETLSLHYNASVQRIEALPESLDGAVRDLTNSMNNKRIFTIYIMITA